MTGQQRASGGLKPGWRRVKFGEVVRHVKDKVDPETSGLARYIAGEHMDTCNELQSSGVRTAIIAISQPHYLILSGASKPQSLPLKPD